MLRRVLIAGLALCVVAGLFSTTAATAAPTSPVKVEQSKTLQRPARPRLPKRRALVLPSYPDAVDASAPKGYWRLGDTTPSSVAVDEEGVKNLSVNGGSRFGAAGAILGDSDTAWAPNHTYSDTAYAASVESLGYWSDDASFEIWFKPATGVPAGTLADLGSTCDGRGNFHLSINSSGQVQADVGYLWTTMTITAPAPVSAGVWNHIVLVRDGSGGDLYLNGVRASHGDAPASYSSCGSGSQLNLTLGAAAGTIADGSMDEAAYYTHKLTGADVALHYRASGRMLPVSSDNKLGGSNGSSLCVSCAIRQALKVWPVDASTGNFFHAFNDLAVPGRGIPLSMAHTYNSAKASQNGPLGYGWTFGWNTRLSIVSDRVDLIQEGGAYAEFFPGATSGTWEPATYINASLTHNGDGTWTVVREKLTTMTFNSSGQLTSIADLNGETTTIARPSGSVMTVTDAAGRVMTFNYSSGKLASVVDPIGRKVTFSVNGSTGNLDSFTDPTGNTTSFTYDGSHRLLTMVDPRNGTIKNDYDSYGRVTDQWDASQMALSAPSRHATHFDYSVANQTSITDPEGNVEVQAYEAGLPVSITKAAGTADAGTWAITYDPDTAGPTTITDPNTNVTTNTWTADGRLETTDDGPDPPTQYTYDSVSSLPLTIVDPSGVQTTNVYSNHVNLTSTSTPLVVDGNNPTGYTRTITYVHGDTSHPGDVTKVTDANNKDWLYGYDTYGNQTSATDPYNKTESTTYDLIGRPITSVSPLGNVSGHNPFDYQSSITYDLSSRPTASFGPTSAGFADSFGRAPSSSSLGTADSGQAWTATTGVWGRDGGAYPVSGTNPLVSTDLGTANGAISFTMPVAQAGMGVVFRMSDASHYWKFTANPSTTNWTLAKVGGTAVTPVSSGTGTCCDPNAMIGIYFNSGLIAISIDGTSVVTATDTEFTANTKIGMLAATGGSGRISYFAASGLVGTKSYSGYDANGNSRYSVDANLHASGTVFDPNNRPTTVYRADGITTTGASYDRNNQVLSTTDPANQATNYTYDHQGRLATETRPGMSAISYSYSYHTTGEQAVVAQPGGGTITTTFDGVGRPATINYSDSTPDVTFGYDHNGRRTSMTTGTSLSSSWQYDSLGRLNVSTRAGRTIKYGYDHNGNNTSIDYTGTGTTLVRHFDNASRLDSITDWNNLTTSFGYDDNSNHTTTTFPNGVVTTNTPDVEGRRTNIQIKKGATTLASYAQSYDDQSQVKTVTAAGVGSNQTYDYNPLDQLSANNGNTIGYDTNDNLNQITSTARQKFNTSSQVCWTTSNWTPTADYTNPCGTKPGWAFGYTFDSRGNRTKTTYPFAADKNYTYDLANRLTAYTQGTTTTASYLYDGDGLRVSKTVNSTTTNYSWDEEKGLPVLLIDGTDKYAYGPDGEPIARVASGGTTTYLHQDHLGSTRLLTNSSGVNSGSYSYSPYGAVSSHSGATTSLQYAGEYADPENGFQYLRSRSYDPSTGQFVTVDPAVTLTGSPYGYAGNNPANGVDPSGLSTCGQWSLGGLVDCASKADDRARDAGDSVRQKTGICSKALDPECQSYADAHPKGTQQAVDISAGILNKHPMVAPVRGALDLAGHGANVHSTAYGAASWGTALAATAVSWLDGPLGAAMAQSNILGSGFAAAGGCSGIVPENGCISPAFQFGVNLATGGLAGPAAAAGLGAVPNILDLLAVAADWACGG